LVTLKLTYGSASGATVLAQNSEEAARSLMYELNVRNGVIMELAALPSGANTSVIRHSQETSDRIRYPRAKLDNEVAIRFGFASHMVGDPPQAFLSYYQTLEYFIPTAIRQSTIKKVRQELRDFDLNDLSDVSLLRVLRAAEGTLAAAEPNQLRIIVNEYVRTSRLRGFFELGWENYLAIMAQLGMYLRST
jgi:hypothetical protein